MSTTVRHSVRALLLATLLGACSMAPTGQSGPVAIPALSAGQTWVVPATTQTDRLSIPRGAILAAPVGKSLTMTVNGIGTPIAPGNYRGKVVLAVTDNIAVKYRDLEPHLYRAALYVNDGRIVPEKSVTSALRGGSYDNTRASNVVITSNEEKFNGIYVTGDSQYTINKPDIRLTGNGGNDFAGYGAAIMVTGKADVTVNDATIINKGVVRTALFVGGDATLRLNNATIETWNGALPADYKWNVDLGRMMEVPWMLGLSGNVRTSNLLDNATLYINNSRLKSQGWGVLSVDDTRKTRMYVTNSVIETVDSGYGAYSIGDSQDYFSACTFNVDDVGVIIGAEGSATFTDGTVVNSGRFGVMLHTGAGGGTITIDKGSVFNTRETAIQAKGRGTTIVVDNAQLNAGNGILVQAMANDDPFLAAMMSGMGAGGPPGAAPEGMAAGGPPPAVPAGIGSAAMVGLMNAAASPLSPDVVATFRNATLKGDLINGRVDQGDLIVTLGNKAVLTGAISSATVAPVGATPTEQTRRLIGAVKNTFGPSAHPKNGAQVVVNAGAIWNVTQTSYLTSLKLAEDATLNGAEGKRITLLVNGSSTPIRPGSYSGRIVVQVGS